MEKDVPNGRSRGRRRGGDSSSLTGKREVRRMRMTEMRVKHRGVVVHGVGESAVGEMFNQIMFKTHLSENLVYSLALRPEHQTINILID